jgi:hypothetical protein
LFEAGQGHHFGFGICPPTLHGHDIEAAFVGVSAAVMDVVRARPADATVPRASWLRPLRYPAALAGDLRPELL